jgi:hypothetical protein
MGVKVLPMVCVRCGSQDVHWLGETHASVFVRCNRCKDVWRLDPMEDRERLFSELRTRASAFEASNAGHA